LIYTLHILGLVLSGYLLWRGAEFLVSSAAHIARGFGISELVVGLTIVAMGTSAPELAVSVTAALSGEGAVALGNVVGSNIFNLGIVLGGAAFLTPLKFNRTVLYRDGGILTLSTLVLGIVFLKDGVLDRTEGSMMLGLMACYLLFLAHKRSDGVEESHEDDDGTDERSVSQDLGLMAVGLAMVVGGGKLLVSCAVILATDLLGIEPWLISVTIVAAGTSAPEMVTTLSAVRRGHHNMAIGGLFGSDIFNVLLVLGTASVAAPLTELAEYRDSVFIMGGTVLATLVFCQLRGGLGRGGGTLILAVALSRWILDALGV
jgi:cation:H+ antiporter